MHDHTNIPIPVVHLLPQLDEALISLLKTLSSADWQQQTIAKQWKVKDVAAHLLDGNIRILSMLRDEYAGVSPDFSNGQSLLDFLNQLNAEWVTAMKRVSPQMLILLHEATGKLYCDYYASLNPFDKAGFAVNWAGEEESLNWMHIAREYTEKWLHQQQIRDAVQQPGRLMNKEFFYPFINTFMMALPFTFRNVHPDENTAITVTISGDAGGKWSILYSNQSWKLTQSHPEIPSAVVSLDPDTSWKLFSKSVRPEEVMDKIKVSGNTDLGLTALTMVSVMA